MKQSDSSKVASKSSVKAVRVRARAASINEKTYLCLYCEYHHYADTVPEMKEHYNAEHPGLDVVFRDVVAYRNKKVSRLVVCPHAQCHFSSFIKDAVSEHLLEAHSESGPHWASSADSFSAHRLVELTPSPDYYESSDLLLSPEKVEFSDLLETPEERAPHDLLQSPEKIESHLADKSFECTTCGWITTDDDAITAHVAAMHASDGGSTVVTFDLSLEKRAIDERYISV
jgi:hypothetical protein